MTALLISTLLIAIGIGVIVYAFARPSFTLPKEAKNMLVFFGGLVALAGSFFLVDAATKMSANANNFSVDNQPVSQEDPKPLTGQSEEILTPNQTVTPNPTRQDAYSITESLSSTLLIPPPTLVLPSQDCISGDEWQTQTQKLELEADTYLMDEEFELAIQKYSEIFILQEVEVCDSYVKLIAVDHTAGLHARRGIAYMRSGDKERAIADFGWSISYSSIGDDPSDSSLEFAGWVRLFRGRLFSEQQDWDATIRALSEVIQLTPEIHPPVNDLTFLATLRLLAFVNRAEAYEERGEIETALDDYKTYHRLTENIDFGAFENPQLFKDDAISQQRYMGSVGMYLPMTLLESGKDSSRLALQFYSNEEGRFITSTTIITSTDVIDNWNTYDADNFSISFPPMYELTEVEDGLYNFQDTLGLGYIMIFEIPKTLTKNKIRGLVAPNTESFSELDLVKFDIYPWYGKSGVHGVEGISIFEGMSVNIINIDTYLEYPDGSHWMLIFSPAFSSESESLKTWNEIKNNFTIH